MFASAQAPAGAKAVAEPTTEPLLAHPPSGRSQPTVITPANGLISGLTNGNLPETTHSPIADDRDNRTRAGRLIIAVEDDAAFAEILPRSDP
jgi:hypothetical protein